MIGNGAKYVAMASLNSSQLRDWAADMATKGAIVTVTVGAMDVTDESSVCNLIMPICAGDNRESEFARTA